MIFKIKWTGKKNRLPEREGNKAFSRMDGGRSQREVGSKGKRKGLYRDLKREE